MPQLVFLCYGNICRSPFAAAYAASRAPAAWSVASAGVGAVSGMTSPPAAVQAARLLGVDLSQHRARALGEVTLVQADLLVAMDRIVFGAVASSLARRLSEVKGPGDCTLTLLLRDPRVHPEGLPPAVLDVPDPIGGNRSEYERVYRLLRAVLDRFLPLIST